MAEARGKIALVTGAGTGVGRAASLALMNAGYTVVLAGRRLEMLEETSKLGGNVGNSLCVSADMTSPVSIAALFAKVSENYGRLDVLFNNAGIGTGGPIAQMSFEDLDRVVSINLGGVLNGAKIGHAYLAKTPGSCLLNTASASAIYGTSGLVVYSATKFGVRALTEGLDGEW
ncbi:MAG: SDR family NAD(P)-dependent oxidoreductase, partial [Bradyrhizobium sp.]|nr:SDR family NAD(P)-dependent oxidoreductase [Bradyrhizobium sp.]